MTDVAIPYKVFTYDVGEVSAILRVEEILGISYAGQDHHGEKTVVVQFGSGFAKISGFRTRQDVSIFTKAVADAMDAEESRVSHTSGLKKA